MPLAQQRVLSSPAIPDRLYFRIGDVARLCDVETYVLRFWETQFPQLKPNKSGTGQRLYRRRDVELALEIKRLVHAEGYTIPGARQALDQMHRRSASQPLVALQAPDAPKGVAAVIASIRAELQDIADQLATPVGRPSRRRHRMAPPPPSSGLLFPAE